MEDSNQIRTLVCILMVFSSLAGCQSEASQSAASSAPTPPSQSGHSDFISTVLAQYDGFVVVDKRGGFSRWDAQARFISGRNLATEPCAVAATDDSFCLVGPPLNCRSNRIFESSIKLLDSKFQTTAEFALPIEWGALVSSGLALVPRTRNHVTELQVWLLRDPVPVLLHTFGGREAGLHIKNILAAPQGSLILIYCVPVRTKRATSTKSDIDDETTGPGLLLDYDPYEDIVKNRLELDPSGSDVRVAISPTGFYFVVKQGNSLTVFDSQFKEQRHLQSLGDQPVGGLAITDSGRYVVIGGSRLLLWDARESKLILLSDMYDAAIRSEASLSASGDPFAERFIRDRLYVQVTCGIGDISKAITYMEFGEIEVWDLHQRKRTHLVRAVDTKENDEVRRRIRATLQQQE